MLEASPPPKKLLVYPRWDVYNPVYFSYVLDSRNRFLNTPVENVSEMFNGQMRLLSIIFNDNSSNRNYVVINLPRMTIF